MNNRDLVVKSVQNAVENYFPVLAAALTPFFAANPSWQLAFYSAIGLYGVFMTVNQNTVNEVVKFIQDNPEDFRDEIVSSPEFQKGFLIFIDKYLKERLARKKKVAENIFLGFTRSEDKEHYELERLNDCLGRISLEALEFLDFLDKEILPGVKDGIDKELEKEHYQGSDRSKDWWGDRLWENAVIWSPTDAWIRENYNPNSHKVRKQHDMLNAGWPSEILHRVENLETTIRSEKLESINELVSLGILKQHTGQISYAGGGGTDYAFTGFGRKFISFVKPK